MSEPRIIPVGGELPAMEGPTNAARPRHGDGQDTGDSAPQPKRSTGKRQPRDRFATLNTFVDCTTGGLSRSEALTWLVLYRDTRDGTARTSAADVARRIGTTRRTAIGAIGRLRNRGLLTQVYRGGLNRGPSIYRVHPLPGET